MLALRFGLFVVFAALIAAEIHWAKGSRRLTRFVLVLVAAANITLVMYLVLDHLTFPLPLEAMEHTVVQHFQRAYEGQSIYPEPSPEFVALAYNPLFYYFSIPFGWVFGIHAATLRLVAMLGMLGIAYLLFLITVYRTQSKWWGIIATGLFFAGYGAMDYYLDMAHRDSWFILSVLLGSYLIDRKRSVFWNIAGIVSLVSAFWFKQHGAFFVIGGVVFLTWQEITSSNWRHGLMRSAPYWIVSALLGPVMYLVMGPSLFGERFIYFTLEVPSAWSQFDLDTVYRFGTYIIRNYLVLSAAAGVFVLWVVIRQHKRMNVWHVQFFFAVLTGIMGTLDPGSSDNVLIPMGIWFIIVGIQALHELELRWSPAQRFRIPEIAIVLTFSLFLFNPSSQITSSAAGETYDDFITFLDQLDGTAYAPDIGYLPQDYDFYPTAHWVALEDLIRGPGRDIRDHPVTRDLLAPLIEAEGATYLITNWPLESYTHLRFLLDYYTIEADLGDRYIALAMTPHRWEMGYPRYLYRFDGD